MYFRFSKLSKILGEKNSVTFKNFDIDFENDNFNSFYNFQIFQLLYSKNDAHETRDYKKKIRRKKKRNDYLNSTKFRAKDNPRYMCNL